MPEERRRECNGLLPLHVSPGSPRRGRSPPRFPLKASFSVSGIQPFPSLPPPEVRKWPQVTKAQWRPLPGRGRSHTSTGPSFAILE
ncbi:hypothetical protein E2C01_045494 [Portunus trituberculatus]|uniref:Uncharacterized protein n=1 Tax=Portunus trituberculatus TaxID=210409 RepID=A0A5B7G316_PORTR|nr:hypothetical protein [Portunus trituberculatus]